MIKGEKMCKKYKLEPGMEIRDVNLQGLDLKGIDLSNAVLNNVNLMRSDLSEANLEGTKIFNSNLNEANLSKVKANYVNFYQSSLIKAQFLGASLEYSIMDNVNAYYTNFDNTNISYSKFRYSNFMYSSFYRTIGKEWDAIRNNFDNARFNFADLESTIFLKSNFNEASFFNVNLEKVDLSYTNIILTTFRNCNMKNTVLPSPGMILLANWGGYDSDDISMLMKLDASAHPEPEKFDKWALGEGCPYTNVNFNRAALFLENRNYWNSKKDFPTLWEVVYIIMKKYCPSWNYSLERGKNESRINFTKM